MQKHLGIIAPCIVFLFVVIIGFSEQADDSYIGFDREDGNIKGGTPISFHPASWQTRWEREDLPKGWYNLQGNIKSDFEIEWRLIGPEKDESNRDKTFRYNSGNSIIFQRSVWFPGGRYGGFPEEK